VTDTSDPWGPYRTTIEGHLDTGADYLSRLRRSLAGEMVRELCGPTGLLPGVDEQVAGWVRAAALAVLPGSTARRAGDLASASRSRASP
jgi:hypothetical protein